MATFPPVTTTDVPCPLRPILFDPHTLLIVDVAAAEERYFVWSSPPNETLSLRQLIERSSGPSSTSSGNACQCCRQSIDVEPFPSFSASWCRGGGGIAAIRCLVPPDDQGWAHQQRKWYDPSGSIWCAVGMSCGCLAFIELALNQKENTAQLRGQSQWITFGQPLKRPRTSTAAGGPRDCMTVHYTQQRERGSEEGCILARVAYASPTNVLRYAEVEISQSSSRWLVKLVSPPSLEILHRNGGGVINIRRMCWVPASLDCLQRHPLLAFLFESAAAEGVPPTTHFQLGMLEELTGRAAKTEESAGPPALVPTRVTSGPWGVECLSLAHRSFFFHADLSHLESGTRGTSSPAAARRRLTDMHYQGSLAAFGWCSRPYKLPYPPTPLERSQPVKGIEFCLHTARGLVASCPLDGFVEAGITLSAVGPDSSKGLAGQSSSGTVVGRILLSLSCAHFVILTVTASSSQSLSVAPTQRCTLPLSAAPGVEFCPLIGSSLFKVWGLQYKFASEGEADCQGGRGAVVRCGIATTTLFLQDRQPAFLSLWCAPAHAQAWGKFSDLEGVYTVTSTSVPQVAPFTAAASMVALLSTGQFVCWETGREETIFPLGSLPKPSGPSEVGQVSRWVLTSPPHFVRMERLGLEPGSRRSAAIIVCPHVAVLVDVVTGGVLHACRLSSSGTSSVPPMMVCGVAWLSPSVLGSSRFLCVHAVTGFTTSTTRHQLLLLRCSCVPFQPPASLALLAATSSDEPLLPPLWEVSVQGCLEVLSKTFLRDAVVSPVQRFVCGDTALGGVHLLSGAAASSSSGHLKVAAFISRAALPAEGDPSKGSGSCVAVVEGAIRFPTLSRYLRAGDPDTKNEEEGGLPLLEDEPGVSFTTQTEHGCDLLVVFRWSEVPWPTAAGEEVCRCCPSDTVVLHSSPAHVVADLGCSAFLTVWVPPSSREGSTPSDDSEALMSFLLLVTCGSAGTGHHVSLLPLAYRTDGSDAVLGPVSTATHEEGAGGGLLVCQARSLLTGKGVTIRIPNREDVLAFHHSLHVSDGPSGGMGVKVGPRDAVKSLVELSEVSV